MAFDYLGTWNKSQLDRFLAFARSQIPLIDARINHLSAELTRIGAISFVYDQGIPTNFTVDATSYLGKLVAVYEVLGGDPFKDLRVRSKTDPVFAVRGAELNPVQYMSNGEVIGARGLADSETSELMRSAKTWLSETLRYRFNRLERKIRRSMDYADTLQNEIDALETIKQTVEVAASFEQLAAQMASLVSDPNYRAVYDDLGKDPFGLTTYAPFSSYDVVESTDPNIPNRSSESAQRQNTGFVGPEEVGVETTTTLEAEQAAEEAAGESV